MPHIYSSAFHGTDPAPATNPVAGVPTAATTRFDNFLKSFERTGSPPSQPKPLNEKDVASAKKTPPSIAKPLKGAPENPREKSLAKSAQRPQREPSVSDERRTQSNAGLLSSPKQKARVASGGEQQESDAPQLMPMSLSRGDNNLSSRLNEKSFATLNEDAQCGICPATFQMPNEINSIEVEPQENSPQVENIDLSAPSIDTKAEVQSEEMISIEGKAEESHNQGKSSIHETMMIETHKGENVQRSHIEYNFEDGDRIIIEIHTDENQKNIQVSSNNPVLIKSMQNDAPSCEKISYQTMLIKNPIAAEALENRESSFERRSEKRRFSKYNALDMMV
ncbi:hypothetical protein [Kozakia baliensis]|uniref:hypothetical protein n=1 Tax=Kozakia baliensis TaxID=153496 RepID=UPI00087AF7D5|nr:hypothetical protein [Kozakia baliensis]AOX19953.1 hypothetical protein A0U90_06255 [Kozakia baliensis]